MERPTRWEPGMHQGFSDPDSCESRQDQTGGLWSNILARRRAQLDFNQRFYREVVKWKYLSDPNVLPFLGVSETLFPFCIITPWLSNGNITEYVKRKPEVDRLRLVSVHHNLQTIHMNLRFRQLAQAASGLKYLHSKSVMHSNINPVRDSGYRYQKLYQHLICPGKHLDHRGG